jgi:hypothetical protein
MQAKGQKSGKEKDKEGRRIPLESFYTASHAELHGERGRLGTPESDGWFGQQALVSLCALLMLGSVAFYRKAGAQS